MNVQSSALPAISALGWWRANGIQPYTAGPAQRDALARIHEPLYLVRTSQGIVPASGGEAGFGLGAAENALPLAGLVPAIAVDQLGSAEFRREHGLRYAYVTGAMANGIASAEIVEAMSHAGMLGFFGAAGLAPEAVTAALDRIQAALGDRPYGFNLIHSPAEPDLEAAIADLYIRRGVRRVEASAYLDLTLPIVRYRVHGIHRDAQGHVAAPNRVIAKISRVEVAAKFFAPPPEKFLRELVAKGELTEEQARLAQEIPVAQDLTAEADSGGHTDNRPAISLLPAMLELRDRMQARHNFAQRLRVGAAGGIATPASAAAALAMGADYLVTGSVNQACVESGTSPVVKQMLAQAGQADTAMAAAADMFEMGVKVQVLKRGTMFAMRAAKLYELYRACESLEALPPAEREALEKNVFRKPVADVWAETRAFFERRDPNQLARADRDPKHRMALVFRWYLGQSSRWAKHGDAARQMDYQVWCGPAMGAFNEWAKGSCLEKPEDRRVVPVALNLLYGAAVLTRAHAARVQGAALAPEAAHVTPLTTSELQQRVQ